jgi:hypothetical protein
MGLGKPCRAGMPAWAQRNAASTAASQREWVRRALPSIPDATPDPPQAPPRGTVPCRMRRAPAKARSMPSSSTQRSDAPSRAIALRMSTAAAVNSWARDSFRPRITLRGEGVGGGGGG